MPTYDISRPTIVDDDGTGTSGTLFDNAFWNDDVFDAIDAVFDDLEEDVGDLQTQGFLKGYDSVVYEYKDAATVTIQAGGQFTSSDGLAFYTVASNTDVSFTSNLSSDVSGGEAASTLYYIWGGEDSNGDQEYWINDDPDTMPSELSKGKRLRGAIYNDGSSNILLFSMTQDRYTYETEIAVGGSDTTEVLDASLGSTFTDVDCSAFVPAGIHRVLVTMKSSATTGTSGYEHKIRRNGDSHNGQLVLFTTYYYSGGGYWLFAGQYQATLDDNGIYEVKNSVTVTTRISVAGYFY